MAAVNRVDHRQPVTADLRRWIVEQAELGCRPEDILAAMRASGWEEAVAVDALEATLRERLDEVVAAAPATALPVAPGPAIGDAPNVLLADGHPVQVVFALRQPRVIHFGGLLTEDECDALVDLARPRLSRSETVDTATGGSEVNAARTSDGMFFVRGETPLIQRIERRIAALLAWPVERGEGLQILHYRPGAEYRPHYDYFDPSQPGTTAVLARGGQRVGTLVMYLNDPLAGGATTFPDIGLEVAPVKGHGVFFAYDRPHPSTQTLHGGAPVRAGEKWVATKWLREGPFS